jgi:hypothetical protein
VIPNRTRFSPPPATIPSLLTGSLPSRHSTAQHRRGAKHAHSLGPSHNGTRASRSTQQTGRTKTAPLPPPPLPSSSPFLPPFPPPPASCITPLARPSPTPHPSRFLLPTLAGLSCPPDFASKLVSRVCFFFVPICCASSPATSALAGGRVQQDRSASTDFFVVSQVAPTSTFSSLPPPCSSGAGPGVERRSTRASIAFVVLLVRTPNLLGVDRLCSEFLLLCGEY